MDDDRGVYHSTTTAIFWVMGVVVSLCVLCVRFSVMRMREGKHTIGKQKTITTIEDILETFDFSSQNGSCSTKKKLIKWFRFRIESFSRVT